MEAVETATVPRDYNSALEIKKLTLIEINKVGQELSEFKPVETTLVAELSSKVYESPVKEAGSLFQKS